MPIRFTKRNCAASQDMGGYYERRAADTVCHNAGGDGDTGFYVRRAALRGGRRFDRGLSRKAVGSAGGEMLEKGVPPGGAAHTFLPGASGRERELFYFRGTSRRRTAYGRGGCGSGGDRDGFQSFGIFYFSHPHVGGRILARKGRKRRVRIRGKARWSIHKPWRARRAPPAAG